MMAFQSCRIQSIVTMNLCAEVGLFELYFMSHLSCGLCCLVLVLFRPAHWWRITVQPLAAVWHMIVESSHCQSQ